MNMAEAADLRVLKARVDSMEKRIADLERRLDDFSKADRARYASVKCSACGIMLDRADEAHDCNTGKTLKLKHG